MWGKKHVNYKDCEQDLLVIGWAQMHIQTLWINGKVFKKRRIMWHRFRISVVHLPWFQKYAWSSWTDPGRSGQQVRGRGVHFRWWVFVSVEVSFRIYGYDDGRGRSLPFLVWLNVCGGDKETESKSSGMRGVKPGSETAQAGKMKSRSTDDLWAWGSSVKNGIPL